MRNEIQHGDNLELMRSIPENSIDLIYADPPFNTGKDFGDFKDIFKSEIHYLEFMELRIVEIARILKPNGAFWLHCDDASVHYLKVLCDKIFGRKRYLNQINWLRTANHLDSNKFARVVDHILIYAPMLTNPHAVRKPPSEELKQRKYRYRDGSNRHYQLVGITGNSLNKIYYEYEFNGIFTKWQVKKETMEKLQKENRLEFSASGKPYKRIFFDEHRGVMPDNLWDDISRLNGMAAERTGYATQKPVELLKRIIKASSKEGDLVMDPFCGSGTTLVAAKQLGRDFLGMDENPKAVAISAERVGFPFTDSKISVADLMKSVL